MCAARLALCLPAHSSAAVTLLLRTEHSLRKQNYNELRRSRDDKQIPLYCYKREDNRSRITFVLDVCHVLAIIQGEIPILYFDAIFFPVNVYSKTVIRSWDNLCIVDTQCFSFIHRSRFVQSSEDLL